MKINLYIYWLIPMFLLGISLNGNAQSCIGAQGKINWRFYENIDGYSLEYLFPQAKYPLNPDYTETLFNLATPEMYNEYYGSVITGFIKAPETGPYIFNITGDDQALFYLSTDTFPANGVLRSELPGWCNNTEHNKYPEQTSDTVQLIADKYYYFKIIHKEGGYGDYVWMYWKRPSNINAPDWHIITNPYIHECLCDELCPQAGTSCDDGNPTTENDLQDGNCHCMGNPINPPSACIGERGSILALFYDGIPGYYTGSMLAAAKYPLAPDRSSVLTELAMPDPYPADNNHFGTRVRGYLRVPVSGKYLFNVTGDSEVRLYLSPNDTTTLADVIAYNDGYNPPFHYSEDPHQVSDSIDLVAGQFYAIQVLHKEYEWSEHLYVFWKTPFAADTLWRIVDGIYLYKYDCEAACLPAGTPCDDGDTNTFNDVYDANCNCAGTPCSDPACTNALGYTPYDPCEATTDRHSTSPNNSWLSCQPTQSPNPARGLSHWARIDFGEIHALDSATIWNYNVAGAAGQGFNEVVVDYSLDGVHWTEIGVFNWPQATGTPNYTGFPFSQWQGISARYLLFTALSNFDNSACAGLSELVVNATTCPDSGTACDDGNPATVNDTYNQFCHCRGDLILSNECDEVHLIKNERPITSNVYGAQLTIVSTGLVKAGSNVAFLAGQSVTLNGGFEVEFGAEFLADIEPCSAPPAQRFLKKLFKRKKKGKSEVR